jgi:SsrA-binding protein
MTTYAKNQKASFDFEILKTISAGLELMGHEVKSVKDGKMNLLGSHVSVRGGEAFLLGSDIQAYQPKNAPKDYEQTRARKLLLSKAEIAELLKAEGTKGLTIVPISVYNKGRYLKIDLGIARGKKKFDKRESLKKRDIERDLKRKL